MNRFHKTILTASASVLAVMAAAPAFAQTAAPDTVEEVVVTGIRASLQAALQQKRSSDLVSEVVTAEDIGKFPDKNVADSLSRVTGVNVVTGSAAAGGFGENERVSIRGTDPNLNLTLLNGHNMATGDWFVLDQTSGGRSFNYSMLPSEVVGRMEILKSASADLPEGGVGGTVNVHTRMPLDLPSLTINGSAQGLYATKAEKWTPQVSGMASWKNQADTFGVLVGAFYQEREFRRDGQEVLGYTSYDNFAGTGQTVLAPNLIGNAYFTQERVRKGGNFVAQWQPNEKLELALSGLYTRMDADNTNVNRMAWINNVITPNTDHYVNGVLVPTLGVGATGSALTAFNIKDGYLTSATWADQAVGGGTTNGLVQDDIFRTAHSTSWDLSLDGTYHLSDKLTLTGQVGYTKGDGATDDTEAWETYWATGVGYTLGNPVTKTSYSGLPADPTSAAYLDNFYSWSWGGKVESPDKETYAKLDLDYDLDMGFVKSLKFGGRYTDHTRAVNYTAYAWAGNGAYSGSSTVDLGSVFAGAVTPSNYSDGLGLTGVGYSLADRGKVLNLLNTTNGGRVFAFYPASSFSVQEKTQALYGMAKIGGDHWRGNVGVRAVHTDQDSTQYSGSVPATITNVFGSWGKVNVSRDYWDILPSANLTVDAKDDLLVRFSAAKVMARPGYAQLAGAFDLNDTALTGEAGGNPNLDPFRAWQFNAAAEWYYAPEALLSVGVFYLDIDSYITTHNFQEFHTTQQHPQGATFTMTGPVNGSGGTNRGLEVSLQQPIGGGFGFIVNYTYADAKTEQGAPIDGNSKNTYNLTGYFENDLVSARLAYNFRSKFKTGVDRGTDMFQDNVSSLDGSVSVNLNEHVALTFDAQNLTGEKLYYYVGNPSVPRAYYDNGRTFYAGARLKF
jgi:iron complex outermembrane receptor protein